MVETLGAEPPLPPGQLDPRIRIAELTAFFAITPEKRAWSKPGNVRRRPVVPTNQFRDALGSAWTPLPAWKQAIDLTACLLGMPFLGLCTLVMCLLTRCFSRGPVFFRQERIGYLGRRFQIYKFRTMRMGADGSVHRDYCRQLIHTNAPMAKLDSRGDARLIPCAWLLRASGLDELPQLINVLRGEMSLVGPRPCTTAEFEQHLPWQRRRFGARPGLTGLWQVSGKNRTTFEHMVRLDIRYARKCSCWLDLKIIVSTVPCLVAQVRESVRARKSPPASGRQGPPETPGRTAPNLLREPGVAQGNACMAS